MTFTSDEPSRAGGDHIFVLFDDGARDIDAATARLETERGLCTSDTVVILRRFSAGELPADMVQARCVDGGANS